MSAENPKIPDWARKEREQDFAWIVENLHVFLPAAEVSYKRMGRGVIFVDTTLAPTGEGHPFGYLPQQIIEEDADEDTRRIVREYNPKEEIVIVLFKPEERTSTYRIWPNQISWQEEGKKQ